MPEPATVPDQSRSATRYLAIVDDIETEIGRGQPNDKLGSERALAERFSCQRGTVRRALQVLESRGLIYRRDRSGWYQTPARLDYILTGSPPLEELTAHLGRELRTEVLTSTIPVGHRPPPDMVFVARRLRRLDGWPIVVEDIHLLSDLAGRIKESDLRQSTKAILSSVEIDVSFEQAALEVVAAPRWVSDALGLRIGGSVLEITRQRFSGDHMIQCDTEWWRSESVRLHVTIQGEEGAERLERALAMPLRKTMVEPG